MRFGLDFDAKVRTGPHSHANERTWGMRSIRILAFAAIRNVAAERADRTTQ
jgi:hypothetical protein